MEAQFLNWLVNVVSAPGDHGMGGIMVNSGEGLCMCLCLWDRLLVMR